MRSVAVRVCQALKCAGHQAYLVGGCVRDELVGREPKDYDVATSALPTAIEEVAVGTLGATVLSVGRAFGVVMMRFGGFTVEVASFRSDGAYTDSRRPDSVELGVTPRADAARRDFTVNAMFLDPETGEVLDFFGGKEDLERRLVRAVGDPRARIAEDRLRLVRAIRFGTVLDFKIEERLFAAVSEAAPEIVAVSWERIEAELRRILLSERAARGLTLLRETGLLQLVLPEVAGSSSEFKRASERLEAVSKRDYPTVLAAVLADCSVDEVIAALRRLKLSRVEREQVLALQSGVARARNARDWPELCELLCRSELPELRELLRACGESEAEERLSQSAQLPNQLPLHQQPGASPLVTGAALLESGVQPGPGLGRLLREAYRGQLEGRFSTLQQGLDFLTSRASRREEHG